MHKLFLNVTKGGSELHGNRQLFLFSPSTKPIFLVCTFLSSLSYFEKK